MKYGYNSEIISTVIADTFKKKTDVLKKEREDLKTKIKYYFILYITINT